MSAPEPMNSHFADQVVVVTGAGSGIGRATAAMFAGAGAHVLGVGRRPDALAESAAQHPSIVPFSVDVTQDDAPEAVVQAALSRWGRIDVLVNNAGAFAAMPLEQATAARITQLLAVNVVAPSLLAGAALPYLKASRGAIVNVSSTFGHRPAAGAGHYAASKAALEQLTRSWALELASDGIRVNAVAPGPTESEALTAAGLPDAAINQIKADEAVRIPLGRRGDPAEIAAWILRLAGPHTAWLTGQVLTVDGGLELS
ncbi:SDR family NAD(P)-dependent oxidoreductase [Streptomyces canus]|uniref:NAD(P)-dependent dehydrogenase (Short-subunit alcohol dehydrogenase family) n=1 Tax=Streptomyces canus TaxID=58343 RepID=A0AAW8FM57_9ACTN|nr:SDR family oxidoreductase [Streptomyces canus]MDQ0760277.1 NAD(P)-dependent dehydrogenase (short-subunit alcohol dehydrogenase family) [Streptomyces canus]MDQ0911074.1 NAD(P)-dependent dehydrogenase (short-subunit alcohol dehydrogenase family) [Streptomyces canus]